VAIVEHDLLAATGDRDSLDITADPLDPLAEPAAGGIESIVYANQNLSHAEANERLGGLTALLKAHISIDQLLAKDDAALGVRDRVLDTDAGEAVADVADHEPQVQGARADL
jgi:hypothetical protein